MGEIVREKTARGRQGGSRSTPRCSACRRAIWWQGCCGEEGGCAALGRERAVGAVHARRARHGRLPRRLRREGRRRRSHHRRRVFVDDKSAHFAGTLSLPATQSHTLPLRWHWVAATRGREAAQTTGSSGRNAKGSGVLRAVDAPARTHRLGAPHARGRPSPPRPAPPWRGWGRGHRCPRLPASCSLEFAELGRRSAGPGSGKSRGVWRVSGGKGPGLHRAAARQARVSDLFNDE
jgi:hypothetical protein